MRIIAWVLLVLGVFSTIGGFANGSIQEMAYGGTAGFIRLLGYFLPAIIAVILFIVDRKVNKN